MNDLLRRRRAMMGQQKSIGPVEPVYEITNRSLTTKLDTGVLLLQEGKTGWCVYADFTYTDTSIRATSTSNVFAFYQSYWHWCRSGETVGCNGRMTSDNYTAGAGNAGTIHTILLNANFETMKLDVILNDGEIVKPTVTIPNRLNSTDTATFGVTNLMTLNRLAIWDHPLTQAEINNLFKT